MLPSAPSTVTQPRAEPVVQPEVDAAAQRAVDAAAQPEVDSVAQPDRRSRGAARSRLCGAGPRRRRGAARFRRRGAARFRSRGAARRRCRGAARCRRRGAARSRLCGAGPRRRRGAARSRLCGACMPRPTKHPLWPVSFSPLRKLYWLQWRTGQSGPSAASIWFGCPKDGLGSGPGSSIQIQRFFAGLCFHDTPNVSVKMLLRWATTTGEGLLQRRQDLPEEAFFVPSAEQLDRVLPYNQEVLLHGRCRTGG